MSVNFNSRPYARGDSGQRKHTDLLPYFNSRPYARGDKDDVNMIFAMLYFNSRPYARGDTPQAAQLLCKPIYFNSRPYARGDHLAEHPFEKRRGISIHAPTRGATEPIQCRNLLF